MNAGWHRIVSVNCEWKERSLLCSVEKGGNKTQTLQLKLCFDAPTPLCFRTPEIERSMACVSIDEEGIEKIYYFKFLLLFLL